jgi:ferredoxin-NADP reductase
MCFHAPFHALPNGGFCALIFPTLMFVYALDAFYAKAFMSERIQTVKYKTVKTGTQLTMKVSDRFVNRLHSGGYVYICFDWLDKHQWHAYSIYENPLDKSERHIFIANNGDWTESVHKKLKDRNTSRPVLISGPFPSPYTNAENYDNLILVAAGIGITPALSAIEAFRDSRRMNLVWATRDVSQLVFFLQNAKLDHKGFNLIFYTGSDPVPDSIEKQHSNANLSIIKSRPNLSNVLVNIISYFDRHDEYHSSDQSDMPDNGEFAVLMDVNDTSENESYEKKPIQPTTNLLNRTSALVSFANELGYDLSDLTEIVEKKLRPVSVSDNDHSGDVDVRSTQNLLDNDVESGTSMMNPANTLAQSIWEEDPESRQYVQSMSDDHLERWGLMYCGARNKLLETLIKESKDLNISFHDEAFDW